MSHIRAAVLVVCLMASAVAGAADGVVCLYLQPLPPDPSRLTFTIASVAAVAASGAEHPLGLGLKTVRLPEASRQRLLASGRLPSGSYVGFALRIQRATFKSEQGESALAVSEDPVRVDLPFFVGGPLAPCFWLTLEPQAPVAGGPPFSPAFSARTPPRPIAEHTGFVTNSGSNTITIFDRRLAQAVGIIDTCGGPAGMALDRQRRRAYVACSREDEIQSIDVATGHVVERSRLSPGDHPREIALTPDGLILVSVNAGSNSVSFFDALSLARQERVAVGTGPGSLLVDAAGRRAFVFNTLSSSISVVDVASRTVVATLATDSAPLRGQLSARGDRIYVIHERSPYMTVLDPAQMSTVAKARLRIGVGAIAVDSVRGLVCVGGANDTAIEFYDPNALMPLYAMRARFGVSYLAIDVEDSRLYMVSPDARVLAVGRLADRKVVSEIDVGDAPYWVAIMGER